MTSTILDSVIFRDIFTTEAMRRVFSDEQRIQRYLDVEAGLARVQARLGIIPAEAAEEIQRHCSVERHRVRLAELLDPARYAGLSGELVDRVLARLAGP